MTEAQLSEVAKRRGWRLGRFEDRGSVWFRLVKPCGRYTLHRDLADAGRILGVGRGVRLGEVVRRMG